MSTIIATTLSNGSVSVPTATVVNGSAKAWVNFDGTVTAVIRESANVSSITDNGTGNFNVNLTTALTDANYVVSTTGNGDTGDNYTDQTPTSSSFRTMWIDIGSSFRDPSRAQVSALR